MIVPRSIGVLALCALAIARAAVAQEPSGLPVPNEEKIVRDALAAGHPDDALAGLAAAIRVREAQATAEPAAAASAIDDLAAAVYSQTGGTDAATAAADAAFQKALAIRTKAFGERGLETARSWSMLSTFAYLRGRWDDAEALERKALSIRREKLPAGDVGLTESLDGVGVVLIRQGRLSEAEPLLEESARIFATANDAPAAQRLESANSLAELYRQQDRLEDSERTFRRAVAEAEALGPDAAALLARLANNLGGLLKDEGNLAEAESLNHKSLALREAAPELDPADLSVGYLNLAEIYRLEGNAAEAEPLYLKSIVLAKEGLGPEHPDLATHYGQLGVLYRDTGRTDEARKLSDQALELLSKSLGNDHPLLAQAFHDRGMLEAGAGKPAVAVPFFEKALAIREKVFGPGHVDVAATLTELARAESAAGPKEKARAAGHVDRAIKILDASKAYPDSAIDARALRAQLARSRNELASARTDLVAAAELVESLRPRAGGGEATRAAFLAKHAGVYDELVDLLLTQGRIAEAFGWAERARGRALLDQLASQKVDLRSGIPEPRRSELRKRETAARSAVAEWQARLDALTWRDDLTPEDKQKRIDEARKKLGVSAAELRRVDEETKNESALWRASSGGQPVSLDAAQKLLAPGERLFAYQIGANGSWLIEIPAFPGDAVARRLTVGDAAAHDLSIAKGPLTRAALSQLLDGPAGLIAEIERRPVPGFPDESSKGLGALFDLLVPTTDRAAWKAASGIIVVPDGPLARLPFEALIASTDGRKEPRYWLDDGPPLRYAVSATLLSALAARPRAEASGGLLSVADPDYGPEGSSRWARLPGTAKESDAVTAAFRRNAGNVPVTSIRGADATESAVKAAITGKRYLHLAVHGVVDEGRGDLLAALALSDGLLQLFEIYELDVSSDVAVLSACATQSGTAVAGEGVFALSRGFLARGARRVIASQWEVDDASTATLVSAFFEDVAHASGTAGTVDYAKALASAKKKVRTTPGTAAPFFWAPFVLSGLR
jgi:tetratricopeptide (TPR) repeat protein